VVRRRKREAETPTPSAPAAADAGEPATLAEARRITPIDIQQKEFRVAVRGYHEGDVDRFLDEVTEEMARLYAENKRLREDLEFSRTTRHDVSAGTEANALLRRAREEAARIMAEAREAAQRLGAAGPGAGAGAAAPAGAMAGFIARERAFLQSLATLIQEHAEGVKGDLRRTRDEAGEGTTGESAPGQDPGPGPETSDPAGPPTLQAPVLADDDSAEDRSVRELFWGED
jgi:DivIVA domain-containing protein